jgi:glycosyltransferase involved in cell wall biosynthesis
MMDISAVLTCHREGLLLGPAIASFQDAIKAARTDQISVEALVVIDRGDHLTKSIIKNFIDPELELKIQETDYGDPGQTRNAAVEIAKGDYVSFLDGDDLWSYNWLAKSLQFSLAQVGPVIAHSEVNVVFGGAQQMWWHADSESSDFELDYLHVGNYWDAMCFTERKIMLQFPFRANNLNQGFGHEDWHWNCLTLGCGIPHRPVPETVHFKRRRKGSQMAKCDEFDVTMSPAEISRFDWKRRSKSILDGSFNT